MRTYLYKLTSDRGGAPCAPSPRQGQPAWLSLAICKPAIRRTAVPGDRIFGLTSRVLEQRDGYPPLSIIYGGTVTEVLDAAVYYGPHSPHRWRPDCIYRYDAATGTLEHSGETGLHADPRHRRRDLGREGVFENGRILLCGDFTYLGQEAVAIPESLVRLRSSPTWDRRQWRSPNPWCGCDLHLPGTGGSGDPRIPGAAAIDGSGIGPRPPGDRDGQGSAAGG